MSVVALASHRDSELVSELKFLFLTARNARRERHNSWLRNYRLLNNRVSSSMVSSWVPQPRDSEIYPNVSSFVAWMTDQEIVVDAIPAVDPNTQYFNYLSRIANDLGDLLYSTWTLECYDSQLRMSLFDTATYGVGILKSVWENSAASGYGNALLRRTDPWSFYIDPDATSLDDANYMIEARRMSFDEIERRYPDRANRLADLTGSMDEIDEKPKYNEAGGDRTQWANMGYNLPTSGTYGSLGAGGVQGRYSSRDRRPTFSPHTSFVVYEFWIRENSDWYDDPDDDAAARHIDSRWRVIVMSNDVVLMDEYADDLWSHRGHPYERLTFDDTGDFYGISLVDHLAYPQIYINRLLTAAQQNAELVGNPIFLEPQSAGLSRIPVVNKPGQRLPLQGGAAALQNQPKWLEPPQMPAIIMDLIQFWISRIENTIGLRPTQKGDAPSQRNAEGVINAAHEAAFVRVRSYLDSYEVLLRRCSRKIVSLIVDNFTESRTMAILGQDGQLTSRAFNARHFYDPNSPDDPLDFALMIRAGASTPTSRQARMAEAIHLFTLGAVDDQYVLEVAQVRNIPQLVQRNRTLRQQGLFGGGGGGGARQRAKRQQ